MGDDRGPFSWLASNRGLDGWATSSQKKRGHRVMTPVVCFALAKTLCVFCHLFVCLIPLSIFGFKLCMKPLCFFWEGLN
jgi:dolichyl-phosphate-mannose--protein O-mannosyl transferase